ncbi:MAG: hypothetical protein N3C12_12730 [Candidatus Binatia bacterium]|nr:hypothetical protein [Candidatus Binatia bacterium]
MRPVRIAAAEQHQRLPSGDPAPPTAAVSALLLAAGAYALYSRRSSTGQPAATQGGDNSNPGGRASVTLEEMEELYNAKLTPKSETRSSSYSDNFFEVRPENGDGYLTLGEAK